MNTTAYLKSKYSTAYYSNLIPKTSTGVSVVYRGFDGLSKMTDLLTLYQKKNHYQSTIDKKQIQYHVHGNYMGGWGINVCFTMENRALLKTCDTVVTESPV